MEHVSSAFVAIQPFLAPVQPGSWGFGDKAPEPPHHLGFLLTITSEQEFGLVERAVRRVDRNDRALLEQVTAVTIAMASADTVIDDDCFRLLKKFPRMRALVLHGRIPTVRLPASARLPHLRHFELVFAVPPKEKRVDIRLSRTLLEYLFEDFRAQVRFDPMYTHGTHEGLVAGLAVTLVTMDWVGPVNHALASRWIVDLRAVRCDNFFVLPFTHLLFRDLLLWKADQRPGGPAVVEDMEGELRFLLRRYLRLLSCSNLTVLVLATYFLGGFYLLPNPQFMKNGKDLSEMSPLLALPPWAAGEPQRSARVAEQTLLDRTLLEVALGNMDPHEEPATACTPLLQDPQLLATLRLFFNSVQSALQKSETNPEVVQYHRLLHRYFLWVRSHHVANDETELSSSESESGETPSPAADPRRRVRQQRRAARYKLIVQLHGCQVPGQLTEKSFPFASLKFAAFAGNMLYATSLKHSLDLTCAGRVAYDVVPVNRGNILADVPEMLLDVTAEPNDPNKHLLGVVFCDSQRSEWLMLLPVAELVAALDAAGFADEHTDQMTLSAFLRFLSAYLLGPAFAGAHVSPAECDVVLHACRSQGGDSCAANCQPMRIRNRTHAVRTKAHTSRKRSRSAPAPAPQPKSRSRSRSRSPSSAERQRTTRKRTSPSPEFQMYDATNA